EAVGAEAPPPRADLICCGVAFPRVSKRGALRSRRSWWGAFALCAGLAPGWVACSGAKPEVVAASEPAPQPAATSPSSASPPVEPTPSPAEHAPPPELIALEPSFAPTQDLNLEI